MDEELRLWVLRFLSDIYDRLREIEAMIGHDSGLERRVSLAQLLMSHFDSDELDSVAWNIGIDSDHIAGDTREERVHALISLCERRQMIGRLLEECMKQRPSVAWEAQAGD